MVEDAQCVRVGEGCGGGGGGAGRGLQEEGVYVRLKFLRAGQVLGVLSFLMVGPAGSVFAE